MLRCNHCDAAPCVEICPVNALHKRKDAIVDLDRDICIGCRACMQACPYDALYFQEDKGVAEKCHYCAHRTEIGLEPACVVVCPERAIIAGDTSDPTSEIAQLIETQPTSRRKVEKGTKPRVWYVDALPEALRPGDATEPKSWLWADRTVQPPPVPTELAPPADIVTTLNAEHAPVWGWHIWTYLVTKNIAAGAGIVAPFLGLLGVEAGAARRYVPEVVALVFLGITTFLLIHDLGRPERFWRLLLKPNTRSWLVKGGWFLTAFGVVTTKVIVARAIGFNGLARTLRVVNLPLAVMTSGYSAFLFAQCKGRDLWLDRSLFGTLVLEAVVCGAALAGLLPAEPGAFAATVAAGAVVVAPLSEAWKHSGSRWGAPIVRVEPPPGTTRGAWTLASAAAASLFLATDLSSVASSSARRGLAWAGAALVVAWLLVRARAWIRAGQAEIIS